jgi:UDP-3-O-[3-hydroxymyristoyl] glucosamine N-acyltransferase
MTTHRCVQIGCGSRAQTHVGALSDSDRFELAAVCDLDRERAAETADRFDIEGVHTDLHEAVTSAAPAHVSVVTPPSVRLSVVTGVLDHDVDSVLLEKPLANSLEEAQAITDALAETEVRGTVCHQTPWSDELRALGCRVMVGHSCVINDSTVGDGSLVGFNSTVDQSQVGRDCVIASGAVVQHGTTVPAESFAYGVPANIVPLSETTIDVDRVFDDYHSGEYADLAERHDELFE